MRKLAWVCGSLAAGVFLAVLLLPRVFYVWLAGSFAALGTLGILREGRYGQRLALLGWGLALGVLCCAAQEQLVLDPAEALAGQEQTVVCRALEYPEIYEDYSQLLVRLGPGLPRVRCRITDYNGRLGEIEPGDELRCTLNFRSARLRYGEPSDMYTSRGIFLRANLDSDVVVGSGNFLRRFPQALCRFLRLGVARFFPEDVAPFHTALLSGDKDDLYDDLDTYYALNRAGLMHVTAVSGMHVSFLVGFVLLLFPNRRRCAVLLQPLLLLFAAMTGFSPSVVRAVFMQLCLLLAPLLKRESDSLTSLLLILAILLLINPQAAAGISLQLSFAATLGIVLFTPELFDGFRGRLAPLGSRVSRFLAASLSVSLGALAFTAPLMALHFASVSLLAPLSNVLCLWLISGLFVGGYGVVLLGALWPAAGEMFGWLLAWGDRFVFWVSSLISSIPNSCLYTENKAVWLWLALVYGLVILCRIRECKRLWLPVSLTVVTLCLCLLLPYRNRNELRLTVLDVGQGSCALLEGGRSAVMVDCGGNYSEDYPGEVAAYYALSRQRRQLDALILTHLHADHMNGVERLMALVDVDTIYLPCWEEDENHLALRALAAQHGAELCYVREDMRLQADGWELAITAPLGGSDENENGLFVRANRGEFDVLIGGDATAAQERRYVEYSGVRDVDVLVVNHHGSDGSSGDWTLQRLKPKQALISVGYNNYGHPDADALARLRAVGAEIHRTDEDGHLTVSGKE